LKLVGLGDRLTHLPRQLSGGQEQRVAIARAIVTDPDLTLADEPTGNLDATSATEVLTLLSRLNKEFGKTIVMVTHDPHAARFATKIRHLEKGELLPEGQVPADYASA
jgi:putative ABC transport system ATP-binding protein